MFMVDGNFFAIIHYPLRSKRMTYYCNVSCHSSCRGVYLLTSLALGLATSAFVIGM